MRGVAELLTEVSGKRVSVKLGMQPALIQEQVPRSSFLPGWAPTVSLRDGLRECYESRTAVGRAG
jgi:hypothetical protein